MVLELLKTAMLSIGNQLTWWCEGIHKKDEFSLAGLALSLLILAIFWFVWAFVKPSKGKNSLPPGPRGLPMVGYLPFLGTNLHHTFTELAHRYGPIHKLWLGNKLYVVVSSKALAKQVVRDHDTTFGNRDPPIAALAVTYGGLDIAWSSYGSHWRTMQKVFVREMLSNRSLEAGYNLRRDEVRKTIREIYTKIGTPINIGEISFLTQLNVTMSMLWGSTLDWEKMSNIKAEFREVIMKITETLGKPNISDFFPTLARFDLQGVERNMKRLLQWVERILDPLIERMKSKTMNMEGALENDGNKDFLQILLELKEEEDTGTRINTTQIKALLMDIVVGGTDTTSTMVELVMAEIINNPEVMMRVQEELADVVGKKNMVEESHPPKLLYLHAVVKETFRLHPPLPLLVPRRPSQSCIVGGYTIPKDSRVLLNVWAMHRDPRLWEDSSKFKPKRFLNCNGEWDYSGNNFQYLPFGSGRRICAGLPLVERTLMYVLASLLHSFQWKLPAGEELDLSERFGLVIKKKTPLIVIPTPILSTWTFTNSSMLVSWSTEYTNVMRLLYKLISLHKGTMVISVRY